MGNARLLVASGKATKLPSAIIADLVKALKSQYSKNAFTNISCSPVGL
jgi:hypothetical protein